VVTGDITQVDLPNDRVSGLIEVKEILSGIDGIEFVYFDERDVVRHRLVQDIIKAYDRRTEATGQARVQTSSQQLSSGPRTSPQGPSGQSH